MPKRKDVTVSVTMEITMTVDEEAWELINTLNIDESARVKALAEHPTTKVGEFIPECAQILNVEDADEQA